MTKFIRFTLVVIGVYSQPIFAGIELKCESIFASSKSKVSSGPMDILSNPLVKFLRGSLLFNVPRSNEYPIIFKNSLIGLKPGGIYAGLAHAQNYAFIGYSRPSHVLLFDRDPIVISAHQIIIEGFKFAENAKQMQDLFDNKSNAFATHLRKSLGFRYYMVYNLAYSNFSTYFANLELMEDTVEGRAYYQNVRQVFLAENYKLVTGNLELTIPDELNLFAQEMQQKLKVFYSSNALGIEYFPTITPSFIQNLGQISFTDDAVLLSTWQNTEDLQRFNLLRPDWTGFTWHNTNYTVGTSGGWTFFEYVAVPYGIFAQNLKTLKPGN